MEASVADPTQIPAGGNPVEPGALGLAPEPEPGAAVAAAEPEGTEPDPFAPLMSRMDEIVGQFGQRLDGLVPQAEPQVEPSPLEQLLGGNPQGEPDPNRQPDYRDLFDENPEGFVEALQQQAVQQAEQRFEQRLQPLVERVRDQDLAALEDEFPALATDEVAKPVLEAAASAAQQFGRPELATDPDFIRMQYLAQRGEEAAKQETPAGAQQQVRLETGGGAPPEPQQNQFERLAQQPQSGASQFWGVG